MEHAIRLLYDGEMKYPTDYDCVWLAYDERGAVGAMITAGPGVIPAAVLYGAIEVAEIESAILTLPETANAKVMRRKGDLSSFIALCRRGLFIYDWTDIYKPISLQTGAYELVAIPDTPISTAALPSALRSAAAPLSGGTLIGIPSIHVR